MYNMKKIFLIALLSVFYLRSMEQPLLIQELRVMARKAQAQKNVTELQLIVLETGKRIRTSGLNLYEPYAQELFCMAHAALDTLSTLRKETVYDLIRAELHLLAPAQPPKRLSLRTLFTSSRVSPSTTTIYQNKTEALRLVNNAIKQTDKPNFLNQAYIMQRRASS